MYYVFRKSVNSDEIKNCEKYTDLEVWSDLTKDQYKYEELDYNN